MSRMFFQRNIPAPAKIYSFNLNNFVGGLNNREYDPEENQCKSVMNMAFTADGVMEKRRGTTHFDDLDLAGAVTFMDEFKPHQEDSVLIRASKDKMYMGDTLVRTLINNMHGTNYEGRYFFGDTSGLYCYGRFKDEPSTYIKHIGTKNENYLLMEVVDPPSGFTPLGSSHTKGVRVYDYTNKKVWYEPCDNEIKDTFKGANVVPKKPRFFVTRESRMYIAGSDDNDDTVYITDVQNPFYFPAVLPLQLPPNSDRVTGLGVFNDSIVVGRRLDIHVITGDTNRTDAGLPVYRLKKLNSHTGITNQGSIVNVHNFLFFLGTDSHVYGLRGTDYDSEVLQTTLLTRTVDIHGAPISVQKDDIWTAKACFYNDCYYLSIGNRVLVYHYIHRAWTVYNQLDITAFYVMFNVLLMGNKVGRTLIPSNNHLDNGKPYRAHWTTKYLTMSDANSFKMFREFFIIANSSKDYTSRVNILFEIDHSDIKHDVDIKTSMSVYGNSIFGDVFINRAVNASQNFPIYRRGRGVNITFWNGDFEAGKVATFDELNSVDNRVVDMLIYVEDEKSYYRLNDNAEWVKSDITDYDQGMCVMELNGEYEIKWKR